MFKTKARVRARTKTRDRDRDRARASATAIEGQLSDKISLQCVVSNAATHCMDSEVGGLTCSMTLILNQEQKLKTSADKISELEVGPPRSGQLSAH